MDSPFEITIYDKAFDRVGFLGNPIFATFTPRLNAQGTGEFAVNSDDANMSYLLDPGGRLVVRYRGEHLMSGIVRNPRGGFTKDAPITFQLRDDWAMFAGTLGWPVPVPRPRSSGLLEPVDLDDDAQSFTDAAHDPGLALGGSYYVFPDGSGAFGGDLVESAEAAVKNLIQVNLITRIGRPVTLEANLDRGGDARAAGMLPEIRFDPLGKVTQDLLAWSGLALEFQQSGTTVIADVREPEVWGQVLTVESGVVVDGEWSRQDPEATRDVVGGPGEQAARAFRGSIDTAREADWGDITEVFRDATGYSLEWPGAVADELRVPKYFTLRPEVDTGLQALFLAYLDAAAAKGLTAGAPTSGLSLELAETTTFHFGGTDGIHLGDTVTASSNGIPFTDRITEATLSFDASNGLTVTPRVGKKVDDPDVQIADAIARLATAQARTASGQ